VSATASASAAPSRPLRFAVVGAGMSGILAAIELRRAGYEDVVVYEKADRPGGTWRENTYPGIACDVPSHFYSYSFEPKPDWSHRFAPGAEIQTYFEDVARRHGVTERIRFGREVVRAAFEDGRWQLALSDGSRDAADVVIAATGVLHHPSIPAIEGLDSFAGACFHSARWDHSVPLEDKRVGVIGTGSTAIQITSALAGRVAEFTLFQRTAQWVAKAENPAYTDEEKEAFRRHPESIEALRAQVAKGMIDGFANVLIDVDSPVLLAMQDACIANLEQNVRDPVLREKLRPKYRAACKRLIISPDFYEAIQRPNTRLVSEGIERVEPGGVRTRDGVLHALDVLVLATGFRVDRFVRPMQVFGPGGVALDEAWKEGPFAYLAIAVPGFPNYFLLQGPNSPVGNFSLIEVAEMQLAYVRQLVERLASGACDEIAVSEAAARRFDAERRASARKTIWATGCRSWYLDQDGLPTAWPFTWDRFRAEMAAPRWDDYEMRRRGAR
jgi:cation diffusion facilitator CzcD-associated flavoprotein CzcO